MRCIRPQLLYIYLYVGLLTVVLCRVLRLGCLQRPLAVTLPPHLLQHRRLKPAAAAATTSAHAAPCSPAPGTQENFRIQENCSPCRRRCHRRRPARQLLRGRRARRRRGLKGEQWGTGRLCPRPAEGAAEGNSDLRTKPAADDAAPMTGGKDAARGGGRSCRCCNAIQPLPLCLCHPRLAGKPAVRHLLAIHCRRLSCGGCDAEQRLRAGQTDTAEAPDNAP